LLAIQCHRFAASFAVMGSTDPVAASRQTRCDLEITSQARGGDDVNALPEAC
jgi:hypothetical protein